MEITYGRPADAPTIQFSNLLERNYRNRTYPYLKPIGTIQGETTEIIRIRL